MRPTRWWPRTLAGTIHPPASDSVAGRLASVGVTGLSWSWPILSTSRVQIRAPGQKAAAIRTGSVPLASAYRHNHELTDSPGNTFGANPGILQSHFAYAVTRAHPCMLVYQVERDSFCAVLNGLSRARTE